VSTTKSKPAEYAAADAMVLRRACGRLELFSELIGDVGEDCDDSPLGRGARLAFANYLDDIRDELHAVASRQEAATLDQVFTKSGTLRKAR
jgi:hypothetical protein